ncbi:hypothetical protein KIPB_013050, partial [Kipferlia bialata]|eukprot:g13050.t1
MQIDEAEGLPSPGTLVLDWVQALVVPSVVAHLGADASVAF